MKGNLGQAAGLEFDPATRGIMPDDEVTSIHILRHGSVEELERRAVRGQLDHPLSAHGLAQSERLVEWFARLELAPDRIISSDLQRCSVLGDQLSARLGTPLELAADLREQHMGTWQGQTWKEITEWDAARVTAYWDNYVETTPPEGESMRDLATRVTHWWESVLTDSHGKTVLIVTHVGVIRVLLCRLMGIPTSNALRFAPATASHTSVLCSAAGSVLNSFGERPWLS
ncbi:MAG: alpha-ribazole phosphatase [Chlamydiales bacterium]